MYWVLGIVGAAIGGAAGYFAFDWFYGQGFYAIAVPGALVGFGCSMGARTYSIPLGILSGLLALGLGLAIEWNYFATGNSVANFLTNLFQSEPVSLLLIALGGFLGFLFGKGNPKYKSSKDVASEDIRIAS